QAADPGADDHADVVGVLVRNAQTGPIERLLGRRQSKMLEARHAPRLFRIEEGGGLETLDLTRELGGIARGIELGDSSDAASAGEQVRPGLLGAQPDAGGRAETGDDDAAPSRAVRAIRKLFVHS